MLPMIMKVLIGSGGNVETFSTRGGCLLWYHGIVHCRYMPRHSLLTKHGDQHMGRQINYTLMPHAAFDLNEPYICMKSAYGVIGNTIQTIILPS